MDMLTIPILMGLLCGKNEGSVFEALSIESDSVNKWPFFFFLFIKV